MPSHRRHPSIAWSAIGGLVAALLAVPLLASPAEAYTASGTIAHPLPAGNGSTDLEFALKCPTMPLSQGVNGWIFDIPSSVTAGTVVGLLGTDAQNLHDIATYVYKSDCSYSRVETGPGKDLYITLAAGDKYLSVFTANGVNVTVNLVAPATPPSVSINDPLFAQSGEDNLFTNGQWGMRKVNAPAAWSVATGAGVTVADIDSGLDLGHPDFSCTGKVNVVAGSDFVNNDSTPQDDNGHGTHTAGIIGACTNNGIGVVGAAPDATIMPLKVLDANGSGNATWMHDAIHKATDQGAQVINMSIGFGIQGLPYTGGAVGWIGLLPEIDEAVNYAWTHGVVIVASAGNESSGLCDYPALAYHAICVGSSDPLDLNAWYGNFPVKDDPDDLVGPGVLAPGGRGVIAPFCDFSASEILSTYDRAVDTAEGDCDGLAGYATIQGTSMAAPMVSGIAALVYDKLGGTRSTTNAQKVVEAITHSAVDLYTPGYDPMSGYGRVDALAAVNYWP